MVRLQRGVVALQALREKQTETVRLQCGVVALQASREKQTETVRLQRSVVALQALREEQTETVRLQRSVLGLQALREKQTEAIVRQGLNLRYPRTLLVCFAIHLTSAACNQQCWLDGGRLCDDNFERREVEIHDNGV